MDAVNIYNNINGVADYVILYAKADEDISLSNLKLQKLLYYIQAWSYGIKERPLFDGIFQAWVHGPVNPEIFTRFKQKDKTLYSEITKSDVINKNPKIPQEDCEHIELVLNSYLKYSGADLERISHAETPWQDARRGYGPWERCENEITPTSMKEFYGSKWKQIQASS